MTAKPRPGRRKPAVLAQSNAPSDAALIRDCVIYAQAVAAFAGGFEVDPDGDNQTAASLGARHSHRARRALANITVMPAATPQGLSAKARVAMVVLSDNATSMEVDAFRFLEVFATEANRFLRPICEGRVTLEAAAKPQ